MQRSHRLRSDAHCEIQRCSAGQRGIGVRKLQVFVMYHIQRVRMSEGTIKPQSKHQREA